MYETGTELKMQEAALISSTELETSVMQMWQELARRACTRARCKYPRKICMHGARAPLPSSLTILSRRCRLARTRSIHSSELTDVDQTERMADARKPISADTDRMRKIKLNSMGSRAARAFHPVSVCVSRVHGTKRNI